MGDKTKDKISFVVRRDADGEIISKEVTSPLLSLEVELRPLTYGESKQFLSFGLAFDEWKDDDIVNLLLDKIVSVNGESFDGLTKEDIQDMEAWVIVELLQCIAFESGLGRMLEPPKKG